MRVFRQQYKARDGKARELKVWYIGFTCHRDLERKLPGFSDKGVTTELARRIERLVSYRRMNMSPDPETCRWLEGLDDGTRERLQRFDLIDSQTASNSKPLSEHVADFEADLQSRGRTPSHYQAVLQRVRKIVEDCGFVYFSEITATRVQRFLSGLRDGKTSPQTCNHYLRAMKQFARWMVTNRRATESPLTHLEGGNVRVDVRRRRRELSQAEIERLLQTARNGGACLGLNGWQRFTLYATALGTGLRAGELASLTPSHFDLSEESPTVRIDAKDEKARRGDVLPLPPDLAKLLAPWLATMPQDAFLWPGPWAEQKRGSRFIQRDLEAARTVWIAETSDAVEKETRQKSDFLRYRNTEGMQADFHSLRHAFLSRLGRSGASPKVMQRLARHSTVELTLGRYTHASVHDLQSAVEGLPSLPLVEEKISERLQATGTDGRRESDMSSGMSDLDAMSRISVPFLASKGDRKSKPARPTKNPNSPGKTGKTRVSLSGEGGIRTPGEREPTLVFETSKQIPEPIEGKGIAENTQADMSSGMSESDRIPDDLLPVVNAWKGLPEQLKSAILTLVRSVQK